MFLNNKKTPIIPHLLYENRFVKRRLNYLTNFLLNSALWLIGSSLPSELLLKIDKFLSNIMFPSDDILNNNSKLRLRESTWFWENEKKICGPLICKPLEIIFKSCLEKRILPLEWKKANVALVHTKMTNNL